MAVQEDILIFNTIWANSVGLHVDESFLIFPWKQELTFFSLKCQNLFSGNVFWNVVCQCLYPTYLRVKLFSFFVHLSTFTLGVLWQFCTDCFETLRVFSSWYGDVHVVRTKLLDYFLSFFHIVNLVIFHPQVIHSGYLLWAQLLLQFCTDCFETLHILSPWYEDVHLVIFCPQYMNRGTSWAQLLIQVYTNRFETLHMFSS